MKYNFLSVWGLPHKIEPQWEKSTDSGLNAGVYTEPTLYTDAYVRIVADVPGSDPFYIKASNLLLGNEDLKCCPQTFNEFFQKDFDENLFVPVGPELYGHRYLEYFNATAHQYRTLIDAYDTYVNQDTDEGVTSTLFSTTRLADLNDLQISQSRYPTNLQYLDTNALVTVSGLIHQVLPLDFTNNVLYIKDGGKTAKITGYHQVDFISFSSYSTEDSISKYPLSELQIVPSFNSGYYGPIQFTQIPESIEGKVVMLSIAGYLIIQEEGVLEILSGNTVQFDFSRINIEEKVFEASKYIDLSSLQLSTAFAANITYQTASLRTDAMLEALMGLSQSFLIIVPKQNLRERKKPFRQYGDQRKAVIPGYKKSFLKTKAGRLASYLPKDPNDRFSDRDENVVYRSVHRELNEALLPEDFKLLSSKFPDLLKTLDVLEPAVTSISLDEAVMLTGA